MPYKELIGVAQEIFDCAGNRKRCKTRGCKAETCSWLKLVGRVRDWIRRWMVRWFVILSVVVVFFVVVVVVVVVLWLGE